MSNDLCNFGFTYKWEARRIKPKYRTVWQDAIKNGATHIFTDDDFIVFDSWEDHNVVPTAAQNYILGAAFTATTPASTWYLGLHSAAYTCLISDSFTTFLTNAVEVTAYTGTPNRLAYTPDTVANGTLTNTVAPTLFTFSGPVTVNGGFLTNTITQGASTGYLISAVRTASAKTFVATEQLKVTAGLTLTSV